MPPPQRAEPARKSARGGVVDGSRRPHPPHPQPVGSWPRLHARKDKWSGVGERRTPDAPHPGKRRLPRAPSCRPHSAQSQLARARAVGLVTSPHARTPRTHSQWVVGPCRTPDRTSGRGWDRARTPDAPHPGKRRLSRAPSCRPHSVQSQLARARAVGLVTGPHTRTPRTHSQWVVGPCRTPDRTSGRGWDRARAPTPRTQATGAPPGRPQAVVTAGRASSHERTSGVADGSPRPSPPHPQPVNSGPRPHARQDDWSGPGERLTADAPDPGKRRPPRAPSCCPQSTKSQLARARAVGLVTGSHARTPGTHSQWVVGPGRTPERTSAGSWESAQPRTPRTQARGAPPGHSHGAPTARHASSQERAWLGW